MARAKASTRGKSRTTAKTRKTSVKSRSASKTVKTTVKAVKEAFTKSQLIGYMSERSGLTRKEVSSVMEAFHDAIDAHLKPRGIGEFTIPGVLKLRRIRKPAKKARKGINPFTGEETMFKAKPATNVVKARILKKVKDIIN